MPTYGQRNGKVLWEKMNSRPTCLQTPTCKQHLGNDVAMEVDRENMKIESKPAARHQHVSNDSQTEEIGGGGSKVANLPTSWLWRWWTWWWGQWWQPWPTWRYWQCATSGAMNPTVPQNPLFVKWMRIVCDNDGDSLMRRLNVDLTTLDEFCGDLTRSHLCV